MCFKFTLFLPVAPIKLYDAIFNFWILHFIFIYVTLFWLFFLILSFLNKKLF